MLAAFLSACVDLAPADAAAAPEAEAEALVLPPEPEGLGLTYEVYVRSFQDSDGDGVGDLAGVASRLPALEALGVRTLWLMPIFPAFGPAGYDVVDFGRVTPAYGTAADLRALVDAAHARGMRVLVDLPFNHVHASHPWFTAALGGDAEARRRFVFREGEPPSARWWSDGEGGSYYAYFGAEMPDLDWTAPETAAALDPVFDGWLDAGADGYRLDAVLMLVEEDGVEEGSDASHTLVGEWVERARAAHPDAVFLAEASEWEPERAASWLDAPGAPGADSVLDFPREDALEALATGDAAPLDDVLAAEGEDAARMATFLGSHDLSRLPGRVPDAKVRRALRVVQLLLPGAPVLYYGEELDLADATSGTGQDYAMRAPMPWTGGAGAGFTDGTPWFPLDPGYRAGRNVAAEARDPGSMLRLVQALGCVREAYGLADGGTWARVDAGAGTFAFSRTGSGGTLFVVANLGAAPLPLDGLVPAGLLDLAASPAAPPPADATLAAGTARVFGDVAGCRVVP